MSTTHPHINFLRGKQRLEQPPASRLKKTLIGIELVVGGVVVCYGLVLAIGFFAVKFHGTDVAGTIDPHNQEFQQLAQDVSLSSIPPDQLHLPSTDSVNVAAQKLAAAQDRCQVAVIQQAYPVNAKPIAQAITAGVDHATVTKMVFAVRLRANDQALTAALTACLADPTTTPSNSLASHTTSAFPWANSEEWGVVQTAFTKDLATIQRATTATGVESRMIVSVGMVEQLRLYFTEREFYEKFFRPLKILGNATQFAWGVMAIKEADAIDIENHLHSVKSPFYLGPDYAHGLDFQTTDQAKERLARLTNEKNHYFSYLYGGFELAQFMKQWQVAGYPLNDRPEILATLYNIGFSRSKPNNHPAVGGSTITIAGQEYTFGSLAFEFYYSGLMVNQFPLPTTTLAQ